MQRKILNSFPIMTEETLIPLFDFDNSFLLNQKILRKIPHWWYLFEPNKIKKWFWSYTKLNNRKPF